MWKPIGETGENKLTQTIHNVCVSAFGIIGVDVWLHDEMDSSFNHAAYYRHHISYRPEDDAAQFALARIEDTSRNDYVPAYKIPIGAGLAGYFWSICSANDRMNTWRDVRAITSDPDQPQDLRMKLLERAGYCNATGVPFDIRGYRGIVIYLARASADYNQLTEMTNEIHLRVSADLIGALSCSSITSVASINAKKMRNARTLGRIRAKMLALVAFSSLSNKGKGLHTDYADIHIKDDDEEEERMKKPSLSRRISSLYTSKTYRENQVISATKTPTLTQVVTFLHNIIFYSFHSVSNNKGIVSVTINTKLCRCNISEGIKAD